MSRDFCPECSYPVDPHAADCPNCGFPIGESLSPATAGRSPPPEGGSNVGVAEVKAGGSPLSHHHP